MVMMAVRQEDALWNDGAFPKLIDYRVCRIRSVYDHDAAVILCDVAVGGVWSQGKRLYPHQSCFSASFAPPFFSANETDAVRPLISMPETFSMAFWQFSSLMVTNEYLSWILIA